MPDELAKTMTPPTDQPARPGPALSATSDMPFKSGEPAPQEPPTKPVDSKPEPADTKPTEPEQGAGGSTKPPKEDKTPPAIKREITIERNKRRAAEAEAANYKSQLDKALDGISKLSARQEAVADARPRRDQFSDPDAYDDALVEWSARTAAEKAKAEARTEFERDLTQRQTQAQQDAIIERWQASKAKFAATHPDYEEVAETDDIAVTVPMAAAMIEAGDEGPAIAYWLGQNPEEANRIAKLTHYAAAIEMGKIVANLSAKPARASKPEPITPLGSRGSAAPKSLDEMSMEEYAAKRLAEEQAKRRPFVQRQ